MGDQNLIRTVLVSFMLVCCWDSVESYKILVVAPFPSKSHHNIGKGIADVLHNRGHEITFINCFSTKNPPYREIVISELHDLKNDGGVGFNTPHNQGVHMLTSTASWLNSFVRKALENEGIKKLMKDKAERFDLVMIEYFLNEPYYGDIGNPLAPDTVPNLVAGSIKEMNLYQRAVNVAATLYLEFVGRFIIKPSHAEIYNKYFPDEAAKVNFYDLHKHISLAFSNTHPSFDQVRPLLPNVIEIGGYHIGETKPLTEELKTLLDNAKNGVIYFSMGSILKSSDLPENIKQSILKAFSKLKQTVLWKFEADLPEKPKNVIIKNWMPQNAILNHPNVKLFITHGGLLSTIEAVSAGVPLLTIPIFGDQVYNGEANQNRGTGLKLDFSNITDTSFFWAVNEIVSNPKYSETARRTSQHFHDRPMHPRELITFYVEHVIRTGGAQHLSSPRLGFLSIAFIDVIALFTLPPLAILLALFYGCRKCCGRKTVIKSERKHKNH